MTQRRRATDCHCTTDISGPLIDRIDSHINVPAVKFRELTGDAAPETNSSDTIRNRVIAACARQLQRFSSERSECSLSVVMVSGDRTPQRLEFG